MAAGKKITELTTANPLSVSDLTVVIQSGETRQATVQQLTRFVADEVIVSLSILDVRVSALEASVSALNTGLAAVSAAATSVEATVSALVITLAAVSAVGTANTSAIASINTNLASTNAAHTSAISAITSINSAHTSTNSGLVSVNTVITSINAAHTSTNSVVGALEIRVSTVSAAASTANAAVTSINTVITSVNAAHTSVLTVVTSINAAHTSTNAAVGALEVRVSTVSAVASAATAAIVSINTVITSVNAAHTSTNSGLVSVNTVITSVNAAHTSALTVITSINAAHTSTNSVITALEIRVSTVSANASVANAAIVSINTVITSVNAAHTSALTVITSINAAHTSTNSAVVSINGIITSVNSAHTSVLTVITSINSAHTSTNSAVVSVLSVITSINSAHTSVVNAVTSINALWDIIPANYGAVGNGVTNDRAALFSADAAAAAAGVRLVINKPHAIATSLTFTAAVEFRQGGKLIPAASATITFSNKGIVAPRLAHIFDFSASGSGLASQSLGADLTPQHFGAVGDGSTNDSAAMTAWIAGVVASKSMAILPGKTFKCNSAQVWDFSNANGVTMLGAGITRSVIDLTAVSAVALSIQRTGGDAFYGDFSGFQVLTSCSGVGTEIGRASFADAINGFRFSQIEFKNAASNAATVALQVNSAYNCDFNIVTNTGGTRTLGTSLQLRRTQFSNFKGSYSGAGVGIHLADDYTFSNVFSAIDVEEVSTAVQIDSATAAKNTFVGGTFVCNTAINATAGYANVFNNPNLGYYGVATPFAGSTGVLIREPGANVTTPTLPATTVAATNTTGRNVLVNIRGGTVTQVVMSEGGILNTTGGTFPLRPNATIAVTYSVAPDWTWFAAE